MRCDIGAQVIHASCDSDSVVNLVVTAGALAVPGSTRQHPIRGLRVLLTGVRNLSKTTAETLKWFDSVVPHDTVIRAQWRSSPSTTDSPQRSTARDPAAVDQFLRRKLDELENFTTEETEVSAPPVATNISLPPSNYCLAVSRNGAVVSVIGTQGSSAVTIMLQESSCHLKLAGFEDTVQYSWGEYPLAPLDDIEIRLIGRDQPHPARMVDGVGLSARGLAKALRDQLRERYRK